MTTATQNPFAAMWQSMPPLTYQPDPREFFDRLAAMPRVIESAQK